MHPKVYEHYQMVAAKYNFAGPFLEVGIAAGPGSILAGSYFQGKPGRVGINLRARDMLDDQSGNEIKFFQCNSNDMRAHFAEGQFATVMSNAVIEHDKYFWRSLDEMKRVLAPGGIMAVGAPGYVPRKNLKEGIIAEQYKSATVTFDVHAPPDYWRFSRAAFKDVICEGLELLEVTVVGRVPVLVAIARKPLTGLLPSAPQALIQNAPSSEDTDEDPQA